MGVRQTDGGRRRACFEMAEEISFLILTARLWFYMIKMQGKTPIIKNEA
jgi:hypothetical protein